MKFLRTNNSDWISKGLGNLDFFVNSLSYLFREHLIPLSREFNSKTDGANFQGKIEDFFQKRKF